VLVSSGGGEEVNNLIDLMSRGSEERAPIGEYIALSTSQHCLPLISTVPKLCCGGLVLTASFISQEKPQLGSCKSSTSMTVSKVGIPRSLRPLVGFGGF
jgi:hypothetical protein